MRNQYFFPFSSRRIIHLLIFILIFISPPLYAKVDTPLLPSASSKQTQEAGTSQPFTYTETGVLLEQNALIRSYQTSLLSTVYWALGVALTMAFFLAGYGWWTNQKLFAIEKERIQEQLDSRINELEAKLALRLETNRTELERSVDAKGEAQLSRLLSELTDVRANISASTTDLNLLTEKLRLTSESFAKRLDATDRSIFTKIAHQGYELSFVEEYMWDSRGVPSNTLRAQCEGIRKAIAAGDSEPYIQRILSRMRKTIQDHFIAKSKEIMKIQYEEIQQLLTDAGKISGVQVGEVFEVLSKVKVD